MRQFLNNLSFPVLIIMAIFLGLAPIGATPHLIEKINMLVTGHLTQAIDIFDLLLHSMPLILLTIKSFLWFKSKSHENKISS